MNVIVPTCNQLAHLVPECVERLNRYWPGQDIVVLHFDKMPDVDCPTYYMGKQAKWGRSWSDPLRETFFAEFDEKYFVMWLDDYMLTETPNMERLEELEGWIKTGTSKAILCSRKIANVTCQPFHNGLLKLTQTSKWRSTLQSSIFRTDYFRFYLLPALSAWDYETQVQYRSMGDGANIICTENGAIKYENKSQIDR